MKNPRFFIDADDGQSVMFRRREDIPAVCAIFGQRFKDWSQAAQACAGLNTLDSEDYFQKEDDDDDE